MEFTFTSLVAAALLAVLAVASGETVVLVGLAPGPHRVVFELADPTHRVITTQSVAFTVPRPQTP